MALAQMKQSAQLSKSGLGEAKKDFVITRNKGNAVQVMKKKVADGYAINDLEALSINLLRL